MTCTRQRGILVGRCASTMAWARPQSSQSAAAAMWALLRGCAAVVVRSTSETRGWQPRLRMTASTGGPPRDSGRQAGIEVARWCVRPPRRCHGPEGRTPRGRDRARQRRDQRRAMYSRSSKVDKSGHGHEGLAEVRVFAGDGLCNREQMVSFSASVDALQSTMNGVTQKRSTMRVCSGVPARRGMVGDGTDVHRALRSAGTWGRPWGPVLDANELLPAESKGVDTAGDAGAVNARSSRGLCYVS
jgi:hypothetical protein